MKKKRNKFVVIVCIICCVISLYRLYPGMFRDKGNLETLKLTKEFKKCNYDTMYVARNKSVEDYKNCEKQIQNILNYVNSFKFKEISFEKVLENKKIQDKIEYIEFFQCDEEWEKDSENIKKGKKLQISFYDNSTLEITASYKGHTSKYFKVDNGEIDFKYINKILSNTEKI